MNQIADTESAMDQELQFSKKLQALTNRIHATGNIDEIMLDLSQDICQLFDCERLTIYVVGDDRTSICSKVKVGMDSFKDFSLPISESSIAGYVALYKRVVNVRNVYDEAELASYTPRLQFFRGVDERTEFRTRECLCAPIVNMQTRELLGVAQVINHRLPEPFPKLAEEGVAELCATLAIAFANRMRSPVVIRTKYDPLVAHGLLEAAELGLATRSARRKGLDVEEVLINEFQVLRLDIGLSLAQFYAMPYEPFRADRVRPGEALVFFDRKQVETNRWLPIEYNNRRLRVMTTDPERVMPSGQVEEIFPDTNITYCVTTRLEFRQTVEQFYGRVDEAVAAEKSNWDFDAIDSIKTAEQVAIDRVQSCIGKAFKDRQYADIQVTLKPLDDKTASRFRKDGSLESIRGCTLVEYQIDFAANAGEPASD